MAGYTALYDACVLYPAPLRDLLLQLAMSDLFRAKWSSAIHDEWIEAVLDRSARDALVQNYENLIPTLVLPDPDDRHVLAAAIRGRCDVIVTYNLKDFPVDVVGGFDIEVQHPDEFLGHLSDLRPDAICSAAKVCRQRLQNPPKVVDEYLSTMAQQRLPELVSFLESHSELI